MSGGDQPTLVCLIAGEPSGDFLGAHLMAAMKDVCANPVRFVGIGGPMMEREGLGSLFPMRELSIMGGAELVPHIPRLLRRIRQTVAAVRDWRPAVLVTIDSPGFTFRVAKRLTGQGFPLVHYVAPTVWAWKPGRARRIAKFLNHLMVLLPFEPPYFEAVGLPCTFVGHPVVDDDVPGDGDAFRRRHGIASTAPVLCVLPGSRHSETIRLLPVFAETLDRLKDRRPGLTAVVPTVETVAPEVVAAADRWPIPAVIVVGNVEKRDAFAAADAALAASGTVALELAVAKVPAVIAYRLNPLSGWLARRLIRVRYVNLINLILDREAVPEFLQNECRAERLAAAVGRLLDNGEARAEQLRAAEEALVRLGRGGPSPSVRAAQVVCNIVAERMTRNTNQGEPRSPR